MHPSAPPSIGALPPSQHVLVLDIGDKRHYVLRSNELRSDHAVQDLVNHPTTVAVICDEHMFKSTATVFSPKLDHPLARGQICSAGSFAIVANITVARASAGTVFYYRRNGAVSHGGGSSSAFQTHV